MSEAPKKIWVDDEVLWGSALEFQSDYKKETPYIRADLVDDLVEALERLIAFHDDLDYGYSPTIELDRATLARVKDE